MVKRRPVTPKTAGSSPVISGKIDLSKNNLVTLFKRILIRFCFYKANNNKNTTIRANNAIASVRANPKMAILNNSSFKFGFLEIPKTRDPNTVPIPTPAPASPMVARPAPIYLAACNNMGR